MEARFNQLERRSVVHWGMRHEVLFGKRRNHDQRDAETSQGKVARLVCGWHDRSNTVRTWDRDWPHMIVKAAAFIKCFNQDGVFPGRAAHERIDQFGRKLCAQLNV